MEENNFKGSEPIFTLVNNMIIESNTSNECRMFLESNENSLYNK